MLHRELGYLCYMGCCPSIDRQQLEIESGAESIVDLYRHSLHNYYDAWRHNWKIKEEKEEVYKTVTINTRRTLYWSANKTSDTQYWGRRKLLRRGGRGKSRAEGNVPRRTGIPGVGMMHYRELGQV